MVKFNMYGRGLKLQVAIVVACQMAFILFGYDQGVFSGIVGNEDWLDTFNHPSSGLEGIIVSIYNLGAFSGCILTFIFGENFGRRRCMWLAMGWIIGGAVLQTTAYSVPHIMVARYITGIGTGIETSTVPMYQAELCDAERRGRLVSSEPMFVGVGIVISYFFDFGMRFVGGPIAWRLPIACQIIFALVVVVLVFGLPESPRWLYYHNRHDEALQVLCDVWDSTPEGERVSRMHHEILETLRLEQEHGEYKWRQLFKRDRVQTGRRVLLAYGMQFMNQMGGINLIVYFVPTALEENVHLKPNLALVIGGCVQTMFFFGSIVPTFTLDQMGRRRPMMWGSLGLALSMMMTASASIAFFFTYMFIFGASANCIPWVYVPEILPLNARAKGTAIGISSNWLWVCAGNGANIYRMLTFLLMITPTIINNLKWKAYLIFMCTNLAFIPLVYFCYPETSNLTLEEVDHLFTKEGHKGFKQFTRKSRPVLESLSGEVRQMSISHSVGGRKGDLDAEKGFGSQEGTEHVEVPAEINDGKVS
ncbi:putative MFS sugar transporter [Hortaea werneckii]|nr:putative MFS sugar transporter [Hortaea werneckii]KAI6850672.1 putative MFS sugar transporter [Hortaea werneckii]KAI6944882.1 putative MFS sugar transporter [Hortaea werneckii]KAI6950465.1 putative MFS sugar transporter [Hortaea werneckii]KAI6981860.1 putative MFS sugar transporter [Hortaea werneckii]